MQAYEDLGGEAFFSELVQRFYEGVAQDPRLRPLYPETDLGPAQRRLQLFLMQYFGGPTRYSEERGHPRLRMRHLEFPVNSETIEAWLEHMQRALDSMEIAPEQRELLWGYFERTAHFLRNREEAQ